MSKGNVVTLQLQNPPERPTYWLTDGSKWKRSPDTVRLMEGDSVDRDALPVDREKDVPVLFRQVRILTPGEWNGLVGLWTPGFIQASAKNFSVQKPRPLQVDHSYSGNDTHGKVLDLMALPPMEGKPDTLIGLIAILGAYAIERVEDGRWDQFSGSWSLSQNEEDTEFLELSFTPFPGCDDTGFLSKHINKEGSMPKNNTKVLQGEGAQQSPETTEDVASLKAQLEAQATELEQLKAQQVAPVTAASSDVAAQLVAQQAEIEALKAEQATERQLRLTEKVNGEVLALVREGHSAPATFENESAFVLSLNDEQRENYFSLRRESPKVWNPGRQSDPVQGLSKARREDSKADAEFDEISQLMKAITK